MIKCSEWLTDGLIVGLNVTASGLNVVLTSAGVGRSAVVETSHAGLTAPPPRVVHTLQTFAAAAIAASRHADVNVAVTSAGPAGSAHTGAPCRVSIETLLTDVTART